MNAYVVKTKDEREETIPITDEGQGPTEVYWPHGLFVAETPAQAKADALRAWSRLHSGVYADDYINLRATLVGRNVPEERGEIAEPALDYWLRYEEKCEKRVTA